MKTQKEIEETLKQEIENLKSQDVNNDPYSYGNNQGWVEALNYVLNFTMERDHGSGNHDRGNCIECRKGV